MASAVPNHSETKRVAPLVSGIVSDVQDLIQQLQLTRKEFEADLRKTQEAASVLARGAGLLFMGGVACYLMLAHWIHFLTIPAGGRSSSGCPSFMELLRSGGCPVVGRRRRHRFRGQEAI